MSRINMPQFSVVPNQSHVGRFGVHFCFADYRQWSGSWAAVAFKEMSRGETES